ncbi:MAG: permease-like cell division protein FtsX [Bacteroidaceae bacterium]|nr:permease-like cell division protein FtsX [Bacteroidaceae bacterium]
MQAFTNTISTTMVLILLGMVILLTLTAHVIGDSVRENLVVTVVLQEDTPIEEAQKLQKKLCAQPYVNSIDYVSKEQALKEHVESMGIDPSEFLEANPFSISMEVGMKAEYSKNDSLLWIEKELKETRYVNDVVYQKDLVENLNRNLTRASLVLLGIAALLVVVSLSLINSTVKLNVYNHRFIIHTMKLVGAKWSYIRRPFLVSSFWIGLVAAFLADAVLVGLVMWAATYDEAILLYVTRPNLLIMTGCVLAVGLLITIVCTYVSVTRQLYKKAGELY